ncbi:hypothetical protein M948_19440 [Virgibacillus sp. CM-4]|nr:hypothetical protein M948_19440 [Virgibacillus sp. CM-4]
MDTVWMVFAIIAFVFSLSNISETKRLKERIKKLEEKA